MPQSERSCSSILFLFFCNRNATLLMTVWRQVASLVCLWHTHESWSYFICLFFVLPFSKPSGTTSEWATSKLGTKTTYTVCVCCNRAISLTPRGALIYIDDTVNQRSGLCGVKMWFLWSLWWSILLFLLGFCPKDTFLSLNVYQHIFCWWNKITHSVGLHQCRPTPRSKNLITNLLLR